ncbi:two-component SAPR family response regulator [Cohnella sp. SGD-V74]|uniref:response regulator n=1 Tax=unclassified Cohnella TaxID=2636738 RepID=UPI000D403031|nr:MULTISPECIES: response regulator [unclassified Cohnella]PRX61980.1 two-component SAPR family response regulator [Cohnella sp. SGD-V74]
MNQREGGGSIRAIVVDDQGSMHPIISGVLGKLPDVEVVGCFSDAAASVRFAEEEDVHLAFIDIRMPGESGLRLAERLIALRPDLSIVFVASHKDYAVQAFELQALDYIVKPVSLERIERSVKRAQAFRRLSESSRLPESMSPGKKELGSIRIYALGGLELFSGGERVKWNSRKSAELFGYLLLHRGRMVSRARLISDVFGDLPPKNAEIYLNTSVYQLRKALDSHGLKTLIQSDADGYGVHLVGVWIDFVEFEGRLRRNDGIAVFNSGTALEIEKLYAGDLFGEKGYAWALGEAERLSAVYAGFVKKLARKLMERRHTDVPLRLLSKLSDRNELDEENVELLLRAYAMKKDQASLAKRYEAYVKILRQELNIEPSEELRELYAHLQSTIGAG